MRYHANVLAVPTTDLAAVIAADGLYKRDVFRMHHPENTATASHVDIH